MGGLLSFMHDAYFAGRSPVAKCADRCCATFLTLCQPIKFAFCVMNSMQLAILLTFWTLGLLCFLTGSKAFTAGKVMRYQVFHTLWHIALPLGGFLWIEYTRAALLWPRRPAELVEPASNIFFKLGVADLGHCHGGLIPER